MQSTCELVHELTTAFQNGDQTGVLYLPSRLVNLAFTKTKKQKHGHRQVHSERLDTGELMLAQS